MERPNEKEIVESNRPALYGTIIAMFFVEILFGLQIAVLLAVPTFFGLKSCRYFARVWATLPRDLKFAWSLIKIGLYYLLVVRRNYTVAKVFEQNVKKHPHKVAILYENEKWTYAELNRLTNKVARYFKNENFQKGDTVALFMENRPEHVCLWLGLSKIGVITALINTNLRKVPLSHSIDIVKSKAIIYSTELASAVAEVKPVLEGDIKYLKYSTSFATDAKQEGLEELDLFAALDKVSDEELPGHVALGKAQDKLMYIYTSGTTGLPKAAIVKQFKYIVVSCFVNVTLGINTNDVIYNTLPIYHSAGCTVGMGSCLLSGTPVVLRKKFSASNFWKDCVKYNCTVAQYIGELCRYLLSTPAKPEDRQHKIRLMCGNGLRAQIWDDFVNRFNIPKIGEFYSATEANFGFVNTTSKNGAIGFIPIWARRIQPMSLVKCDEITGELIRNPEGFCTECDINEPGLLVNLMNKTLKFDGYSDKKATSGKILNNVFRPDDTYFNTGDVLSQDEFGYYYFRDRTGDTFRWKGENVATSEVEAVISNIIDLSDSTVYGVSIPNVEGKAGMAAIVDQNNQLDLNKLTKGIKEHLAAYARPMFIRVLEEIPQTGTFKLKKRDLQIDGYDISKVKDKIYFFNANEYQLLTDHLYNDIITGKIRF